jgi:hypothetical protein
MDHYPSLQIPECWLEFWQEMMMLRRIWKSGFENFWRKSINDYHGGVGMVKHETVISNTENDEDVPGNGMKEALGYKTVDKAFLLKSHMQDW